MVLPALLARRPAGEEEVLRLQVAVHDAVVVQVVDAAEHLLHDDRALQLREVPSRDDLVEQLAIARHIQADFTRPKHFLQELNRTCLVAAQYPSAYF